MKLIIAGLLTASAVFGAITNVTVRGTTAPQAVITAHGGGALTIEVSESSTYSPLVYATDSAKGGTSAAKFDDGADNYTFVIGKRNSALGTDGYYYSQALQTATQHFYRITDASDASTATGSFATPTPASVVTGDDMPLISPGLAGWPSRVNFGDRNERWIDPQTGVQLRPLVLPGDAQDSPTSAASGLIDKATNVGAAAWTGLANIASTSPGTYTSFVGTGAGTQGWVFIRATNFLVPGGPNWGGTQTSYGLAGSDITYWNFLAKGNTTATGCGSSGLDKCKVQMCLTVNGVTCATGIVDVELDSAADTTISVGTGDQAPGLHFWMAGASNPASPPEKQDMNRRINLLNASFPTTTGVRVETDNQTVTWLSGSRFNQALIAGSWVKLGNDFCQIANNGQNHAATTYNSRVIDLADNTCYTGAQSTGITATFANFGVLIRKKSATADTVNLNSADYSFGITPDLLASISGVNEACSTAYAPGNAGLDKGYYCRFLSAGNVGVLYWINSITGEARIVGNMSAPIMAKAGASDTWNSIRFNGPNNVLHDNLHPGTFYGHFAITNSTPANKTAIFKIVLDDPTHAAATTIHAVNSQDRFADANATNLCSSISPGGGTYGWEAVAPYTQTCRMPNQAGTVSYQILTPPSLGKSLLQQLAAFTASDPVPFSSTMFAESTCVTQYVSDGKVVGTCSNATTGDLFAWLWVFDPGDGVTAHAGLVGGPRIVAARPSWRGSGSSWCAVHAIVNPGDVDIVPVGANQIGNAGFFQVNGSGPYRSRITGVCSGNNCTPVPCTTCTLAADTPGDLITVSVDGQPSNYRAQAGAPFVGNDTGAAGEYGNWTVGDYIILCDSATAGCFASGVSPAYEIGQIKSNPSLNRYVVERGHGSTNGVTPGPTRALSSIPLWLDAYCMDQNINGCLNGNCRGGYNYWDYVADPHGLNLGYSVTGDPEATGPLNTVRKDSSDTGSHRTFRANNNLFVHDAQTAQAVNYSGSAYGARSGPLTGFYGLPDTFIASAGYFNNIGGTKIASAYQSHAYRGTNSGQTFFDGVPFFGGSSTGTATIVSKNLYKLASTCSSPCDVTTGNTTLHRKLWPTVAASGRFPMKDISGPGSNITDAGSDAYKYCFVRIAGECFSGSAVGEVYYNLPNMTATVTHACAPAGATTMYSGNDDQTLFCLGDSMMFNQSHLAEIQFIPPIDSRHVIGRNLTRGFSRYLMSHDFLTPVVLADGSWAITMAPFWSGGGYSLVLAKMPPLMTDSTVRSTFVPRQVVAHSSEVPALTVTAYVKYGYEEHGAYNSFYCTSRQEACAVGTNTWPNYSFLVTDTVTPKACDTGCTFTIPAMAGRIGFAQIVFLDNSSVTTGSGPIVAFATN